MASRLGLPEMLDGSHFEQRNVQPAMPTPAGRLNICPHYDVIEICAKFAGINEKDLATQDDYCGVDISPVGKRKVHRAATTCTDVRETLHKKLDLVAEDYSPLTGEALLQALNKERNQTKQAEILENTAEELRKKTEREETLELWRQITYELSVGDSEQENPHFRRRTLEEITDDEAIKTVQIYVASLEENVTGTGRTVDGRRLLNANEAIHCKVTPRNNVTGPFVD